MLEDRFEVTITAEDWRNGIKMYCNQCALAKALLREYPEIGHVSVDPDDPKPNVEIYTKDNEAYFYRFNLESARKIVEWDAGRRRINRPLKVKLWNKE